MKRVNVIPLHFGHQVYVNNVGAMSARTWRVDFEYSAEIDSTFFWLLFRWERDLLKMMQERYAL
jgi:hypothetical protein